MQVKSSPKQKAIFEGITQDNFVDLLYKARPSVDVKTRWNSVVDIFLSSIPYEQVFSTWYQRGGSCPEISNDEWVKIQLLTDVLGPLKDKCIEYTYCA
jgi:hypothetical protein